MKNREELCTFVRNYCSENDITFVLKDADQVVTQHSKIEVNGFFEEYPSKMLAVANNLDDDLFYEILVHEFCHANQCVEGSKIWEKMSLSNKEKVFFKEKYGLDIHEAGDVVDEWIKGVVELSEKEISDYVDRTVLVESDCESRSLVFAKENNLPMNLELYAQKANAYLFTYYYALNNKKWTKSGKSTYTIKEFYELMPTKIDFDFLKRQDPKCVSVLEKHCL